MQSEPPRKKRPRGNLRLALDPSKNEKQQALAKAKQLGSPSFLSEDSDSESQDSPADQGNANVKVLALHPDIQKQFQDRD